MKLIHISDLHIGKRLNNYSLIEDQKFILDSILKITDDEKPDGIIIAGDVYDRSIPSEEAVAVFDDFLVNAAEMVKNIFVISGNHDSAERLSFGGRLIKERGVHISPVFDGCPRPVTIKDEYGEAYVYLLPFIKPVHVRHFYPDEEITGYTSAVDCVIKKMAPDADKRNILVSHQFVTGAVQGGSEEISVGGLDNVDGSVFAPFDYVALGHIHGAQNIGENVRYCGTPLKYSFSEVKQQKSVTVVELKEKGSLEIRTIPLEPMRDMLEIKGTFAEITDTSYVKSIASDSYMRVTLLDDDEIPNAFGKLTAVYPNLMRMDYDNKRTRSMAETVSIGTEKADDPVQLFESFFEQRNGQPMNSDQREYIMEKLEEIWGGVE